MTVSSAAACYVGDAGHEGRQSHGSKVEINPKVMMGRPVIRGDRITVELILRRLGDGATPADLIEAYPPITVEHIRGAIIYAADTVANEETVFLGPHQRMHLV